MTPVTLDHIIKRFDGTAAVDDVSLAIPAGELFFLLGPSGCGKSTLLRLIAGLHAPTSGRILFGERDVTPLTTEKRNAVMCFQSYALWPHMTVADNVRFGLQVRGAADQASRVNEVLKLVQMDAYAGRKPNQLSGGQQQRVALARALAVRPDCLLLDEPLSNLDAKLRAEMRTEIRRICRAAGCTTVYVTHDQKEALSVADRIGIMRAGRMAQVGTPNDLYYAPASAFVADFIGHTNLLRGRVLAADGDMVRVETSAGAIKARRPAGAGGGGGVVLSIRPEQMRLTRDGTAAAAEAAGRNRITGRAVETTFLGEATEHLIEVADAQRLKVVATPPLFDLRGDVAVEFDPADVVVLPDSPP